MRRPTSERGYLLLLVIIFFGIFMVLAGALTSYTSLSARVERNSIASAQALSLAEAGIEKAIYQLNQSSSYAGETGTALGSGTFTTTLTTVDSSTRLYASRGSSLRLTIMPPSSSTAGIAVRRSTTSASKR